MCYAPERALTPSAHLSLLEGAETVRRHAYLRSQWSPVLLPGSADTPASKRVCRVAEYLPARSHAAVSDDTTRACAPRRSRNAPSIARPPRQSSRRAPGGGPQLSSTPEESQRRQQRARRQFRWPRIGLISGPGTHRVARQPRHSRNTRANARGALSVPRAVANAPARARRVAARPPSPRAPAEEDIERGETAPGAISIMRSRRFH